MITILSKKNPTNIRNSKILHLFTVTNETISNYDLLSIEYALQQISLSTLKNN